jgi:hypothetical protein
MESTGVFECVNITKEDAPPGIMKIYMQFRHPSIPYFIKKNLTSEILGYRTQAQN